MESHLLQMRGLKREGSCSMDRTTVSHLLQMRGLKLSPYTDKNTIIVSHLLQMRGLKPKPPCPSRLSCRRIFYRCVD